MSVSLTVTAYKAVQPTGVTLNANGTIRTKEGKGRSSIMVTSEVHTMRNGAWWTQKRVANMTLPTAAAVALDPQAGEDLNTKLKAAFGVDHTVVMVEDTVQFYPGQEPKTRGNGGAIITDDEGSPIYQDMRVAPVGTQDVLVERVRAASAEEGQVTIIAAPAAIEAGEI